MATELTKVTFPDGNYIINSDEKVKQQNYTTYNGEYRLLLSGTDDDTERTEYVGKSSHLTYNPWTDEFNLLDNATLGVFGSSGVGGLWVRHYDIQFNNSDTWDGTHTSLKDAIPNVKQSPNDSSDKEYRILFSNTDDDTERTEKVQKNPDFSFNPFKSTLSIGRTSSSGGVTTTRYTEMSIPGIDISEYVGSTLQYQLSLRKNDITLSSTWDGTNTSLKDTITYLGSQSAVNKVDYIHSTDASAYTIDTLANTESLAVMGVTLSGTPTANHGAFLNVKNVGTPFQLFMPDNVKYIYKRYKNNSTGEWYDWFKLNAGYADTSGISNYNNVPRISKDSRYKPGVNTLAVEEFQNNSANLPNANWYHIYTSEGSDSAYAVQLALGMTVDGAYYRKCSANSWGGWIDLIRPTWANVTGKPTVIGGSGTNKTVTAGTLLNCGNVAVTAGVYLIIYVAGFPAGQANWKTCGAVVSTTSGSSTPINVAGLCNYRYGYDNETRVHGATMWTASGNATLYLNLWGRGSGALAGCFGEIRAFRLY